MWNKLFSEQDDQLLGFSLETHGAFCFFGTRHLKKENLQSHFPQFEFCFLQQIHSDLIVEGEPGNLLQADGHWTSKKNRAVAIQTADCLPVLIASHDRVAAVHAGWRGLQSGILKNAGRLFSASTTVLLGPHIHSNSFEVGRDVAVLLTNCAGDESVALQHTDPEKNYVNLSAIAQIHFEQSFKDSRFYELQMNTFVEQDLASYRRAGGTTDRQYSFIALT